MSKLLVVKGHPLTADYSLSLKGLDAFVKAYKAAHPEDEIEELDVFSADIPTLNTELVSAMFAGENAELTASQKDKLARFAGFTEQFLSDDKVVIANPMYNLMIPAELKSWVDTVNVAGKTFKYTAEGPVGLANGKKVLHLQANGGVYGAQDPATIYMSAIFNFIGSDFRQIAVEGHAYDPEKTEELLAEFINKVELEAQTF
ncbi:FMN-dependent NADH-azoreductase [Lactococcus lactis]|uniref:FMN-dependent NADH-azoreductase n=1 Tax=Lactococcus lactis TaxID=1358 RepID=UPI0027EF078E|nr:FMN-dependent NADH-azoreductase [Lactococcus lactis]MDQ7173906.1 FMN-dependent NADH-azoreductase [Lactococcus lactis]WMM06626.1 FMN-dependent NADH-azoreductase [Lactococcus lactis]WMM19582.1 FMN-dependent NADH-azoreductase [Lactococcus lactis]WMM22511.1 FMN-dependent NADH-azoreductase [Lactococcus lactis]